jgi:hypothetical protein
MINSGSMRWTATIMRESSRGTLGNRDNSYSSAGTFRCSMEHVSSVETPYANGTSMVNTYEVRTRWTAGINLDLVPTDRLVIRDRTFKISGIRNMSEKDRVAIIDVEEII